MGNTNRSKLDFKGISRRYNDSRAELEKCFLALVATGNFNFGEKKISEIQNALSLEININCNYKNFCKIMGELIFLNKFCEDNIFEKVFGASEYTVTYMINNIGSAY